MSPFQFMKLCLLHIQLLCPFVKPLNINISSLRVSSLCELFALIPRPSLPSKVEERKVSRGWSTVSSGVKCVCPRACMCGSVYAAESACVFKREKDQWGRH